MSEKKLVVLDAASAGLLALWLGLVAAYFIFKPAVSIFHVDIAAWLAFGASLLLSGLPRWLYDIRNAEIISPLRLWAASGMTALVFCIASSFIATPKMRDIHNQLTVQNISAQQRDSLNRSYAKTNNFLLQFLCIRAALAIGLVFGLKRLPRKSAAGEC